MYYFPRDNEMKAGLTLGIIGVVAYLQGQGS